MRNIPAAVALLTSRDDEGHPFGMAVSAVISVSMEPPSILISVHRHASMHRILGRQRTLCINFLAEDQEYLIAPFSSVTSREHRFSAGRWEDLDVPTPARPPWLLGARAVIFGTIDRVIHYGTHTLFIVAVSDVRCSATTISRHHPLVWLEGHGWPVA